MYYFIFNNFLLLFKDFFAYFCTLFCLKLNKIRNHRDCAKLTRRVCSMRNLFTLIGIFYVVCNVRTFGRRHVLAFLKRTSRYSITLSYIDRKTAMTGRISSGFKAEMMKISPDVRFIHCIIHREHLTVRKISCELNLIINDIV